jgi:hypothetical protein
MNPVTTNLTELTSIDKTSFDRFSKNLSQNKKLLNGSNLKNKSYTNHLKLNRFNPKQFMVQSKFQKQRFSSKNKIKKKHNLLKTKLDISGNDFNKNKINLEYCINLKNENKSKIRPKRFTDLEKSMKKHDHSSRDKDFNEYSLKKFLMNKTPRPKFKYKMNLKKGHLQTNQFKNKKISSSQENNEFDFI